MGEDERGREKHEKHKHRHKERREDRERSRERDRDKERDKERDREREHRHRSGGGGGRERERSRERSRDRERERGARHEHTRSRTRSPGGGDEHARKRRREEKEPAADGKPAADSKPAAAAAVAANPEQQRKDAEQAALNSEAEKRRKRIEEWRAKKAAEAAAAEAEQKRKEEEGRAAAAAGGQQQQKQDKGWSLEDDDDEEEEEQQQQQQDGQQPGAAAMEDDDEVDPLDAFMAGNTQQLEAPAAKDDPGEAEAAARPGSGGGARPPPGANHAAAAGAAAEAGAEVKAEPMEEDEVDPLDAFMAAEVMPGVKREPAAAARPAPPSAAATPKPSAGGAAASDSARAGASTEGGAPSSIAPRPGVITFTSFGVRRPAAVPAAGGGGAAAAAGGAGAGGAASLAALAARRRAAAAAKRRKSAYETDESEEEEDSDDSEAPAGDKDKEEDDAAWAKAVTAGKLSKGDKLSAVDHSTIEYPPFRRNFYIEVPEIAKMSEDEVAKLRKELDGIKVRGRAPPRPIRTWHQAGLYSRVLEAMLKGGFERPLPIQAQALPIIMSGRDCIGIAKTGSGKTLAFVLPLLRHVKDQPQLAQGDGPIGLIMAPTRELVQQIAKEVKRLARPMGISCVAVFGGSGVANQISELKRGTEVISATPGRLIDLLVTGAGRITNMRRVTYLVMDEADRMFDMGFEPQIMRIVGQIRPDRQCVMFSATFPRSVEALARQLLVDPVEIQVGGRSVVNSDITQIVELRPEEDRFLRLLELLGEWYEAGKVLVFVHSQDKCDTLFRDLLKSGYPCLSLHGGKDQSDRECTITDFKAGVGNILIATSVAARGLDVRDLVLVINYDVPNHIEDYVHRVGRTGRAGAKGTAVTFIGPDEERYAPDLVRALKESGAPIPEDLQTMADAFQEKRKAGLVQNHGSGYGGTGFKFDRSEESQVKAARKAKAKEMGLVESDDEKKEGGEDSDDDIRPAGEASAAATAAAAAGAAAGAAAAAGAGAAPVPMVSLTASAASAPRVVPSASGAAAAPLMVPALGAAGAAAAPKLLPVAGAPAAPSAPRPMVPAAMLGLVPPAAPAAAGAPLAVAGDPSAIIAAAQAAAAQASAGAGLPGGAAAGAAATVAAAAQRAAALAAGFTRPGVPSTGAAAAAAAAATAAGGVSFVPLGTTAAEAAGATGLPVISLTGAMAAPGRRLPGAPATGFQTELEINDFPQQARWKVTHKGFQSDVTDMTGAAVITKGIYVKSGAPPDGERKLYLLIEAPTQEQVKAAKTYIKKIIEEMTEKAMRKDLGAAGGRYTIV